jgi:hypothetical protein
MTNVIYLKVFLIFWKLLESYLEIISINIYTLAKSVLIRTRLQTKFENMGSKNALLGAIFAALIVIIIILIIFAILYPKNYGDGFNPGKDETVVVLHYVDWCGFCKKFKPTWFRIKQATEDRNTFLGMMENNEDKNPTGITKMPTIIKYSRGNKTEYDGDRSYESVLEFIRK